jgi:AraC-like DNA-binding protein
VFCTLTDSGRHYGRHWHDTYGFGLLEDGAQNSASARGRVDAYAGDLITTNPGEVHDGRPLGGTARRWRMVYLEPPVFASMAGDPRAVRAPDLDLTWPVIQDPTLSRAVRHLFEGLRVWSSAAGTRQVEAMACEEALVRACALLLRRHAASRPMSPAPRAMDRVRARLADELLEPPSLAGLASMEGLSKYQLLRRFEKTYGMPPHAWLLAQRAERARRLVRDGMSLALAAAASGFADQSHMTRVFVRHFGFTPGAWQKAAARR